MQPGITAILNDTKTLLRQLEQTNRVSPFERQVISQLFACEQNEQTLTNWLANVAAPLEALRDAAVADKARIAELEAELARLEAVPILMPSPRPVDDITGHQRPAPIREDVTDTA
jgi:hypothetical protein